MNDDTPRCCHVCGRTEKSADLEGNVSTSILGSCSSCHKLYCEAHTSEFDNKLCSNCVSFSNTIVSSRALVDNDGVTHRGRQIVLTGESWMRSRDVISQMTDQELEAKLTALKQAVHEAEMVLEYRRIIYSQVQNEKDSRLSRKLARLRLISATDEVHKAATTTKTPTATNKDVAAALSALKGLGLDKDKIANVLLKLSQKKKEVK